MGAEGRLCLVKAAVPGANPVGSDPGQSQTAEAREDVVIEQIPVVDAGPWLQFAAVEPCGRVFGQGRVGSLVVGDDGASDVVCQPCAGVEFRLEGLGCGLEVAAGVAVAGLPAARGELSDGSGALWSTFPGYRLTPSCVAFRATTVPLVCPRVPTRVHSCHRVGRYNRRSRAQRCRSEARGESDSNPVSPTPLTCGCHRNQRPCRICAEPDSVGLASLRGPRHDHHTCHGQRLP